MSLKMHNLLVTLYKVNNNTQTSITINLLVPKTRVTYKDTL